MRTLLTCEQRISASHLRLRRAVYAKGDPEFRYCGGYTSRESFVELADPLSNDDPGSLAHDDPVKMWLTVDVPASTPPGSYAGTIRATADGSDDLSFAIELRVVDWVLPDVADWTFYLDLWQHPAQMLERYNAAHPDAPRALWSDEHLALLESSYRALADAGQHVITTHIKDGALGGPSMITWIRGADGSWRYDMTAFDRYVSSLQAWGITRQISVFSIVGWNPDTISFWDEATSSRMELAAPIGSAAFLERWEHFLTQFRVHLQARGWFDRTVLYMDEVEDSAMAEVIALVRADSVEWKLGLAYFQPTVSETTRAAMHDLSAHLDLAPTPTNPISTFYTACAPAVPNGLLTPDNSPAEMTWMAWHARHAGLHGYLRWAYDLWRAADPLDIRDGANTAGDFSLVYYDAAANEVMSSIRLELLRDGIQDFERINVLQAAGRGAALDTILAPFTIDSGGDALRTVTEAQNALKAID